MPADIPLERFPNAGHPRMLAHQSTLLQQANSALLPQEPNQPQGHQDRAKNAAAPCVAELAHNAKAQARRIVQTKAPTFRVPDEPLPWRQDDGPPDQKTDTWVNG